MSDTDTFVEENGAFTRQLMPSPALVPLILFCIVIGFLPLACVIAVNVYQRRRSITSSAQHDTKGRLEASKQAAQRVRLAVSGGLAAVGWLFLAFSLGPLIMKVTRQWPDIYLLINGTNGTRTQVTGDLWHVPYTIGFPVITPGMSLILLAVMPGDKVRVNIAGAVIFLVCIIFFLLMLLLGFSVTIDHTVDYFIITLFECFSFGCAVLAILALPTMICEGCCVRVMPTRKALARLWLVLRGYFLLLFVFVTPMITLVVFSPQRSSPLEGNYALTMGFISLFPITGGICAAVLRPSFRRAVHRTLGNLALRGEARAAAAIAAIVGGRDPAAALQHGQRTFRGLPFASLGEVDLHSNDGGTGAGTLYERTSAASLGTIDAFVSHSWHDAPLEKWEALSQWASAQPTPPLLWLDKACIDQQRIDESLVALPVYLSGCKSLLVLVGPTYCSRLWCIMELFTWLQMGGHSERVSVRTCGEGNQLEEQLTTFDASRARCFKPDERQRLLGIIEEAFGDFGAFNAAVRTVFAERGFTGASAKATAKGKKAVRV